jgi:hypothetical protein
VLVGHYRVLDERVRRFADQHLTRLSRLLKAGRHVHRVTRREPLRRAGHDLAGVDADPSADPELRQRVPHPHRSSRRAQSIILVSDRHPKDSHHRVADELLHRAAVRLDNPLHTLEIPSQQRPQRLRIRRLAEFCRTGDVAEQHRHRLALLAAVAGQRRGAEPAELEAVGVFLAAGGTSCHRASLRRPTEAATRRFATSRVPGWE